MVAYFARPTPEMLNAPPGGQVDRLASWLNTLNSVGVIPEQGRLFADIIGTMPLLSRRPHAFALLDITSYQHETRSYKLNTMQAALLIDHTGMETAVERRVRTLLASYADAEQGKIKKLAHNKHTYYRLLDARLPEWATPEWAPIDSLFVVAFGKGSLASIFDVIDGTRPALSAQPWFAKAHQRLDAANRGFEIYIDFQRIRERVGEVVKDRPEHVLAALHLQQARQLLWTVGYAGRSMGSEMIIRKDEKRNKYLRIAGKQLAEPEVLQSIPSQADSYAVFRTPIDDLIRRFRDAYLQSKSPSSRENWHIAWAEQEEKFNFDIERDFLNQLGDHLILHTYPPHPLGVPLLCTIWMEIDGDADRVGDSLNAMMSAWQFYLNPSETQPADTFAPRLKLSSDGKMWYFQLGLVGPAMAVDERWLVISFSPPAVRQNLHYLQNLQPKTAQATPETDP